LLKYRLDNSWLNILKKEFEQPYMKNLKLFLAEQKRLGKTIYPASKNLFRSLNSTPFSQVKVVILGQDPYHGPEQAHGLCFSVKRGVAIPPSLKNIYKELSDDVGFNVPNHGNLDEWSKQGILLLNSVLTVNQAQAGSHQGKGWERFTDKIIAELNHHHKNIVYLLWGAYAQKKGSCIDETNNLILKAVHPSPLSAYRGFLGCQHFSLCNEYLKAHDKEAIKWQVSQ
jgi:uracil-DNA glycosylase